MIVLTYVLFKLFILIENLFIDEIEVSVCIKSHFFN